MNEINIIGIDPGSNNMGVSILTIDVKELKILKIKTIPVNLNLTLVSTDIFKPKLFSRLERLEEMMGDILDRYNPYHVSMETSFINRSRLGAVIPLTQAITTIKLKIYTEHLLTKIFDYSPVEIKSKLKLDFKDKRDEKDKMYDAVKSNKELNDLIDIDKLTEHEIDAIAIAYTHLLYIKKNKVILCLI